jgi:4-hydroxythreonine-4-phosphate dehydrogenase
MREERKKIKIGITQGDVNGVGYEVILKAFHDLQLNELCTPIVYGSKKYSSDHKKSLEMNNFSLNFINAPSMAKGDRLNLIQCCDDKEELEIGTPTKFSGRAAFESLDAAVNDLLAGKIDAVVTAPINKKNIQGDDFDFPGHTEFLGNKDNGAQGLMFMISDKLKVGVVTGHIPLSDVSTSISEEKILDKLKVMNKSLKRDFNIPKPKIAVLGLNPHAGDNGLLGTEEQDIIISAIQKSNEDKILAHGPFPADGFFGSNQYLKYDAVLAMYHDQGLIPFKALSFGEGVNFTAGLSYIRTSPDHGTGYDIAGEGKADESSIRQAIYAAIDIYNSRNFNDALSVDPLKSNQIKNFQSIHKPRNHAPSKRDGPTPRAEVKKALKQDLKSEVLIIENEEVKSESFSKEKVKIEAVNEVKEEMRKVVEIEVKKEVKE